MYQLTHADRIWNRACGIHKLRSLPGDRALVDMLQAHGLAMNGGVLHAVELLSEDELIDSESGYRFFGFDAIASLLTLAKMLVNKGEDLELYERELDRKYAEIIPSDSALSERFERHQQLNPSEYAPLRSKDIE